MPRLLPPRPIDAAARGAAYLNAVAMRLQPGWGQFLDDCRLRLPASHPLNAMTLAASAELVVERDGRVGDIQLASSGNADFDRAVRDAIADAAPLGPPPAELLSDDDRVHLRWLFARDRRQAGPATAQLVEVELPLREVVSRRIAAGELARAALRIERAPASGDRDDVTRALMVAVVREALAHGDGSARRAAVAAVRRAHLRELTGEMRALITPASELELKIAAIEAAGELQDHDAIDALASRLPADLRGSPRLALADVDALAALGRGDLARDAVRAVLDDARAPADARVAALETVALLPTAASTLAPRYGHGDARMRAAGCKAAAAGDLDVVSSLIESGLHDADASVRAACVEAVRSQGLRHQDHATHAFDDRRVPALLARARDLARDRDAAVRARAIAALALDAGHPVRALDDPAAEVRAAYARTLAYPLSPQGEADLRALLDDRDPDVRAAAWSREVAIGLTGGSELAERTLDDPAAQVRLAALEALDEPALVRLAAEDDAPDVRGAALVRWAARRGRADAAGALLERIAAAPPASGDRVRAALAWLLAR